MRVPDAVLQEVWKIKDESVRSAAGSSQRFVEQIRQRSAELRQGLNLKVLPARPSEPVTGAVARQGAAAPP